MNDNGTTFLNVPAAVPGVPRGGNQRDPNVNRVPSIAGVLEDHRQTLRRQQQQEQQKVILLQAPKQRTQFNQRYLEVTCILGITEMVVGLFSIALGIANPIICGYLGVIGYGVWGGVFYIFAGWIAIMARRRRTNFLIITHLSLSIVAAVLGAVHFSLGVVSASVDNNPAILNNGTCLYSTIFGLSNQPVNDARGRVVTDALLAVAGAVLSLAAILHSICTCRGLCFSPTVSASAGIPTGSVQCVPGHVICSAHEGQISAGSRAIINGVITFQGQDAGSIGHQWMLHQAPTYSQMMQASSSSAAAMQPVTAQKTTRPMQENRMRI